MEHLIETDLADLLGTLPCEFELNSCRAKFLILHLCCHTLQMSIIDKFGIIQTLQISHI